MAVVRKIKERVHQPWRDRSRTFCGVHVIKSFRWDGIGDWMASVNVGRLGGYVAYRADGGLSVTMWLKEKRRERNDDG